MVVEPDQDLLGRNGFLRSLGRNDTAVLAPLLTVVFFRKGQRIGLRGRSADRVLFPISLVASFGAPTGGCGFGLIGPEGIIGWPTIIDQDYPAFESTVLFDGGVALAIPASDMRRICLRSPTLAMALLGFAQSCTFQLGLLFQASSRGNLRKRLCAWLLMLHDRIDSNLLRITHQQLARHLNVRRASVTEALHLLEGMAVLRCERGLINIRDRRELESLAGNAYRVNIRPARCLSA